MYGRLGRADDRISQLAALLALEPGPSREVALGLAYAAVGDSTNAVETLGAAARRYPDYPYTYVALGRVWLDIAQTREDRIALEKALQALHNAARADDNAEALMLLGRALLQASDPQAAEDVLQQAIGKQPAEPMAFVYLANAADQLGHTAIARDALMQYHAIEAGGSEPRRIARFALRIADLSMQLRDYPAAVAWFQRMADAGQADASVLVRLAEAQWRAGSTDGARATLVKALTLDPGNAAAAALRGGCAELSACKSQIPNPETPDRELLVGSRDSVGNLRVGSWELTGSLFRQLGIDAIAEAVAQEIEPEHQHRDREPRKDGQMRRVEQMRPARVEHRSPARRRRLDAEAEEAERRLRDDRARHAERRLHDHGRKRRRQDVTEDDRVPDRRRARAPPGRTRTRGRAAPGRARAARSPPTR